MDDWERYLASQSRRYLEHVRQLGTREQVWRQTVEHDEALLDGLRALDYTRERVDGARAERDIDDLLERLEANRAQHQANVAELVDEVEDARSRIGRLEDARLSMLLELRYVQGMDWQQVASRMHHSEDYVRKELHDWALVSMQQHLPAPWRDPEPRAV